jgi:anti-anti-sigma factor
MKIILDNNIKIENALDVKRLLIKKLEEAKKESKKTLVIDFSQVNFIDSTGLGILVSIHKRSIEQGVQLILKNISPMVYDVFEITMLDEVFTIE